MPISWVWVHFSTLSRVLEWAVPPVGRNRLVYIKGSRARVGRESRKRQQKRARRIRSPHERYLVNVMSSSACTINPSSCCLAQVQDSKCLESILSFVSRAVIHVSLSGARMTTRTRPAAVKAPARHAAVVLVLSLAVRKEVFL